MPTWAVHQCLAMCMQTLLKQDSHAMVECIPVGNSSVSHPAPVICERVARQLQGMLRVGLVKEISYRDSALLQNHLFSCFLIAIILNILNYFCSLFFSFLYFETGFCHKTWAVLDYSRNQFLPPECWDSRRSHVAQLYCPIVQSLLS